MQILPSEIILFDLEYTAWEGSQERGWSGPNEYQEIIQIGALRYAASTPLQKRETLSIFVPPKINPVLSDYITELTGIRQHDIEEQGIAFQQALEALWHFAAEGTLPLYSWGDDAAVLEANCELCEISMPSFSAGFQSIIPYFEQFDIETSKYTSGSVYSHFTKKQLFATHNALEDVRSMGYALDCLVQAHPALLNKKIGK